MSQVVVGHFEADGAIIYLPLGFKPDYWEMCEFHTDTNIVLYEWWGRMEDDQASGKKEGISITEGATANLADDGGFAAYSSEQAAPTISDWAASTSATARTATAAGTYVRPTTSSGTEREAVFECVTGGTTGSTEPTWPAAIGENAASDNGVIWQRVNVATLRAGYDGVRIAAALMIDGREYYYLAIQADDVVDNGDVVGWSGGIYGA